MKKKPSDVDVILIGYEMPKISGYEAARQIKVLEIQEDHHHKVKLYGLSGRVELDYRQKYLIADVDNIFKCILTFGWCITYKYSF